MDRKSNMVEAFVNAYKFADDIDLHLAEERDVVYIAGPMSGLPDHGIAAFQEEARRQRQLDRWVVSPVEKMEQNVVEAALVAGADWQGGGDYKRLLIEDLILIATCVDLLVLLPGWENSKGACAEVAMAAAMRIPIYGSGNARIPFTAIKVMLTVEDGPLR